MDKPIIVELPVSKSLVWHSSQELPVSKSLVWHSSQVILVISSHAEFFKNNIQGHFRVFNGKSPKFKVIPGLGEPSGTFLSQI